MISAVAPPGMPIECGMTASWIQRLVNLGSGNMNKIMGCLARNANKPWDPGKQLPLGFSASRQIKKNNINELQATGGGPALSNKQQATTDP